MNRQIPDQAPDQVPVGVTILTDMLRLPVVVVAHIIAVVFG
jgi:hypothetical protein